MPPVHILQTTPSWVQTCPGLFRKKVLGGMGEFLGSPGLGESTGGKWPVCIPGCLLNTLGFGGQVLSWSGPQRSPG